MGGKQKKAINAASTALYRKHRSKSLDEVVGQQHITKTLKNAIDRDKVSHAYLFTGPRGVGKTSVARILAHQINQLPYQAEANHLDIIEIDAASNRRIDDIRDLRDKVHIAPVATKYKVYIIDEVHMLTTESFNALLKTLEEPPAHAVFILATTEAHKLPATIISRTQRHSFKSISVDDIVNHLSQIAKTEGIDIDDQALQLLAQHGKGSFRDSISLLDQMSSSSQKITRELIENLLGIAPKEQLQALLTAVLSGKSKDILTIVESLTEYGVTPPNIALQLAQLIRQHLKQGGQPSSELVSLLSDLLNTSSATYPKLQLEVALLKIASGLDDHDQPNPKTVARATMQASPKVTASVTAEKAANPPEDSPGKKMSARQDSVNLKKSQQTHVSLNINIEDVWTDILTTIKKLNNPLYTIIRLAAPRLEDGVLTLALGFEFHRKRIDDSKHRLVVAEAFKSVTNQPVEVIAVLDKTLATASSPSLAADPPPVHAANASLVANIQDMMGGGEIINAE